MINGARWGKKLRCRIDTIALAVTTGGAGLAFAAVGFTVAPAGWGLTCFT